LSDRLLTALKQKVSGLKLIPSGGGCFEVTVDGELIYSKLATGEFPNEADILRTVEARPRKKP
jgi:selenoprotein W-related protein